MNENHYVIINQDTRDGGDRFYHLIAPQRHLHICEEDDKKH